MSVATGTLEDENYQTAVTPSPSTCSPVPRSGGQAPPRGLGRSAPNRRARSWPPPNRCRIVGQDRGSWRRDQRSLLRRRLRFLDSARKDIFIPGHRGEDVRNTSGAEPRPRGYPAGLFKPIDASAGAVQGREKVVRDLCEASKDRPGDILVCGMTMPAWTYCSQWPLPWLQTPVVGSRDRSS